MYRRPEPGYLIRASVTSTSRPATARRRAIRSRSQRAEVNKALSAVSYLVDQHNHVILDKDDATGLDITRIINKKTGKIIQMTRERNVWTIDVFVEEVPNQDDNFGRRG